MTDQQDNSNTPEPEVPEVSEEEVKQERFPELAELEEKIHRRLRSNQRFLERFMDEDFDDLDEDEPDDVVVDDEPDFDEEL
jgi:hypothetical protein